VDNKTTLVSVILPTFNRTTFLKVAIDSVLKQTYENIELIIVDDSTNNKVKKLCQKYGDRLAYFHRNSKLGIPSAINFGLNQMKGTWYKWMSDDDELPSESIETFVEYANKTKAQILYPNLEYIDKKGNAIGTRIQEGFSDQNEFAKQFWLYQIVIGASLFIKKTCFEEIGYFENDYGAAWDYKWCLKASLLHNYSFQNIPKILFRFRTHKEQDSIVKIDEHPKLIRKGREDIKQELLSINSQKWNTFSQYLMKAEKSDAPKPPTYPYSQIKNESFDLSNETKCKICEHWGASTLLYIPPGTNEFECYNCHTHYNKKQIEYLLSEKRPHLHNIYQLMKKFRKRVSL